MKFSIITPTHNRGYLIANLIESVLIQKYADWELIVVDDGSTDNTKEIILSFNEPRIKYVYQINAERSAARNNGLSHASGEFVIFVDSDDSLAPDFLEELAKTILENDKKVAIYSTRRKYKDLASNSFVFTKQLKATDTPITLFKESAVIPVDQCAHRNCFSEHTFNSEMKLWEDTHLWLRLLVLYPVIETNAVIHMLIHEESTVQTGLSKIKPENVSNYAKSVWDLLEYKDLFPAKTYKKLIKNYIFKKYQMYFYQARLNKQWEIARLILNDSMKYKFDIIYFFKSHLHLLMKN